MVGRTLAPLFTKISQTGILPKSWKLALIGPTDKKMVRKDHSNYRPISQLLVLDKINAAFLTNKWKEQMEEYKIIWREQFGFQKGCKNIQHCSILSTLVDKYIKTYGESIFVDFADLRAAFELVSHTRLWERLTSTSIFKWLLGLIKNLYSGNVLQIKTFNTNSSERSIRTEKVIR